MGVIAVASLYAPLYSGTKFSIMNMIAVDIDNKTMICYNILSFKNA